MELDPIEIRLVLYYTLFLSFVLHNYGGQGHLNKLNLKEVFLYKQLSNCFCLETVLLVKGEVEQCFFTSPWRIFLSHCSRWQVSSDRRDAFQCMYYSQRRGHSCITWLTIDPFRSTHPLSFSWHKSLPNFESHFVVLIPNSLNGNDEHNYLPDPLPLPWLRNMRMTPNLMWLQDKWCGTWWTTGWLAGSSAKFSSFFRPSPWPHLITWSLRCPWRDTGQSLNLYLLPTLHTGLS